MGSDPAAGLSPRLVWRVCIKGLDEGLWECLKEAPSGGSGVR